MKVAVVLLARLVIVVKFAPKAIVAVVTVGVATVAMVTVAIVMPVATLAAVAMTTAIVVWRLQVWPDSRASFRLQNLRLRDFSESTSSPTLPPTWFFFLMLAQQRSHFFTRVILGTIYSDGKGWSGCKDQKSLF